MSFLKWVEKNKTRSKIYYTVISWDWVFILSNIVIFEIVVLSYIILFRHRADTIDYQKSLELILTINGLFSAIITTHLFNSLNQTWSLKKEDYEKAEKLSQKLTDFRRVADKLTRFYQIWSDDQATKSLLDQGKYGRVDYFDYKLMSFSDYEPVDKELIEELWDDPNHSEGVSDLYLGLISLARNRKATFFQYDSSLYGDYQRKGIYKLEFVEKLIELEYFGRLGYWFDGGYHFINYNSFSIETKSEITSAIYRINPKYIGRELDNSLMQDVCTDMQEYYVNELYSHLKTLNSAMTPRIRFSLTILISSLLIGVIFPFIAYFLVKDSMEKIVLTEILISLNMGLILLFTLNLYRLVRRELKWI